MPAGPLERYRRLLVLGAGGGVGRAFLSLICQHPVGRSLLEGVERIFLLDRPGVFIDADGRGNGCFVKLAPVEIRHGRQLAEIIRARGIDLVIELADVDTRECFQACGDAGADYLSTSYNIWRKAAGGPPRPRDCILARCHELLPRRSPVPGNGTFLIGSGMNPGLISGMVLRGLHDFARRIGCEPNAAALELYGIYLTEKDATIACDQVGQGAFPMTWNPYHALEELTEDSTGYMDRGAPCYLPRPPYAGKYRARILDREIEAMLVPHEEVVTLGHRFPHQEVAFLYQIPRISEKALLHHPERHPRRWPLRKLYPPHCWMLDGCDTVGALLCSRSYGEFWLGFSNYHRKALTLGTNATLLQVAAGVLAGCYNMPRDGGLILPEQLDWRSYLRVAEAVLGPVCQHWEADARPALLADRFLGRLRSVAPPSTAGRDLLAERN